MFDRADMVGVGTEGELDELKSAGVSEEDDAAGVSTLASGGNDTVAPGGSGAPEVADAFVIPGATHLVQIVEVDVISTVEILVVTV